LMTELYHVIAHGAAPLPRRRPGPESKLRRMRSR
jgi:hypothetical protein